MRSLLLAVVTSFALALSAAAQQPATQTQRPGDPPSAATQTPGSAPESTPQKAPAARKTAAQQQQAPGASPDKVWVNTNSSVYHCPGDRYYGKTAHGRYMTEAQAKAAGAKGVGGKTCFGGK